MQESQRHGQRKTSSLAEACKLRYNVHSQDLDFVASDNIKSAIWKGRPSFLAAIRCQFSPSPFPKLLGPVLKFL